MVYYSTPEICPLWFCSRYHYVWLLNNASEDVFIWYSFWVIDIFFIYFNWCIPEWFTGWPLWCPPPPHFGWLKITFDHISRHFRSIRNFNCFDFFSQNGCWRQFWMTKNHFISHFSTFQINTQLWFHKMAAGGHFGWPNITFDHISRHFRSMHNFYLFIFLHKMAAGGHFGWPKITFDRISRHIRSIRNFFFFDFVHKMAADGHFEWPKITFLAISDQYTTFFFKIPSDGPPICAKTNKVLPLCVINGYAKYEVDRWIYDTVWYATSFLSFFVQNGRPEAILFFRLMPKIIRFL